MIVMKGFTLVELMVSVAIFVFMTALLVAKYGNFNSQTLLTNEAYDVALALRTAQTYGLSVKNVNGVGDYQNSYGMDFNTSYTNSPNCTTPNSQQFVLKSSPIGQGAVTCGLNTISTYNFKSGVSIQSMCIGSSLSCKPVDQLYIYFVRPYPDAHISAALPVFGGYWFLSAVGNKYARITIGTDSSNTRNISVYDNGQIAVDD